MPVTVKQKDEINTDKLWIEYKHTSSQMIRNQLIEHYAKLVKIVAGKLAMYIGSNVDYEDLCSYGVFGLIDAIDKFDIDKGIKFETYASLRIKGSIIDQIRRMDWIPRSLRVIQKEIDEAIKDLTKETGKTPSPEEVADALGISVDEYYDRLDKLKIQDLASLEGLLDQGVEPVQEHSNNHRFDTPDEFFDKYALKEILDESSKVLTEKELQVMNLFYYEELTQKEISEVMGITESRVSQLHTRVLTKLKAPLVKYLGGAVG